MSAIAIVAALLLAELIGWRQLSNLRGLTRGPSEQHAADVSIVIPARNEADNLVPLLASLRSLTESVSEIIVVDDESTDGTPDIALSGGATLITATVPPGWTGKAWACQLGADVARSPVLLFLDADTVLAPDAVDRLLATHYAHGGLVSVQPYHRVDAAYEQLSAYFNVMSLMGSGAFGRCATRPSTAFGPCLLTARADYERVGGHAAVRADILDDVGLAAAYARSGLPVRCAVGGTTVRMRMYPGGLKQLAEGWTKNFASGATQADARSTVAATVWVAAHFAVAMGGLLALWGLVLGTSWLPIGPWWVWVVGWMLVALRLRVILRRIGSFRWWTWVMFPIPLLAFGVLFARSVFLTYGHRSVRWRGRGVRLTRRSPADEDQ